MIKITENAKYEIKNVISYRGRVTQQQMARIMNDINQIIHSF